MPWMVIKMTRINAAATHLLDYFTELERYENRQTADFDMRRLDRLRDLKDEFSAPIHTALYHSGDGLARPRYARVLRRSQATGCPLFRCSYGARLCDFR